MKFQYPLVYSSILLTFLTACDSSRLEKVPPPAPVQVQQTPERPALNRQAIEIREDLTVDEAFELLAQAEDFRQGTDKLVLTLSSQFDAATFWKTLPEQSFYKKLSFENKDYLSSLSQLTCRQDATTAFTDWALHEKSLRWIKDLDQRCRLAPEARQSAQILALASLEDPDLTWVVILTSRRLSNNSDEQVQTQLKSLLPRLQKLDPQTLGAYDAQEVDQYMVTMSQLDPQFLSQYKNKLSNETQTRRLLQQWGYDRFLSQALHYGVQLSPESLTVLADYLKDEVRNSSVSLRQSFFRWQWLRNFLRSQQASLSLRLDLIEKVHAEMLFSREENEILQLPAGLDKQWLLTVLKVENNEVLPEPAVQDEWTQLTEKRIALLSSHQSEKSQQDYCAVLNSLRPLLDPQDARGCLDKKTFLSIVANGKELRSPWDQLVRTQGENLKLSPSRVRLSFVDTRPEKIPVSVKSVPVLVGLKASKFGLTSFVFHYLIENNLPFSDRPLKPGKDSGNLLVNDPHYSILSFQSDSAEGESNIIQPSALPMAVLEQLTEDVGRMSQLVNAHAEDSKVLSNRFIEEIEAELLPSVVGSAQKDDAGKLVLYFSQDVSFSLNEDATLFFAKKCPGLSRQCIESHFADSLRRQILEAARSQWSTRFSAASTTIPVKAERATLGRKGTAYEAQ